MLFPYQLKRLFPCSQMVVHISLYSSDINASSQVVETQLSRYCKITIA